MQTILQAAEAVLVEKGAQAGVLDIAARGGMAVGTLYNYFSDRDELVRALLDARRAAFLAGVDETIAAHQGQPFRDQLTAVVRRILQHMDDHRPYLRLFLDGATLRGAGRDHRQVALELNRRLATIVDKGVREKVLPAGQVELLAALLAGMLRGLLVAFVDDERQAFASLTGPLVATFLHGAAKRP